MGSFYVSPSSRWSGLLHKHSRSYPRNLSAICLLTVFIATGVNLSMRCVFPLFILNDACSCTFYVFAGNAVKRKEFDDKIMLGYYELVLMHNHQDFTIVQYL